ncbi:MAG: transcriptional repressor [Myxococcales bacterium]|nr:transcriptional repressor [Myxococcales bacterium]
MSKRSTRQKRAIEQVLLAARGPLSAQQIQEKASEISPGLSLATVYRVVREGAEAGTLSTVCLDDKVTRYEDRHRHHHHHFLCEDCDEVFDITIPCEMLAHRVPEGYSVTRHEITLYGHCAECA